MVPLIESGHQCALSIKHRLIHHVGFPLKLLFTGVELITDSEWELDANENLFAVAKADYTVAKLRIALVYDRVATLQYIQQNHVHWMLQSKDEFLARVYQWRGLREFPFIVHC